MPQTSKNYRNNNRRHINLHRARPPLPPSSIARLPPNLVGTRTAARWLGVTPRTVRRWCHRGRLAASQNAYHGYWLISPDSIRAIRDTPAE